MKRERIIIIAASGLFAVIFYFLLPLESRKYLISLHERISAEQLFSSFYADLDSDGIGEYIRCKADSPVPAISITGGVTGMTSQWNLGGKWVNHSTVISTDTDRDGFGELVAFTHHNDSIWLHVVEPLQSDGIRLHRPFCEATLYNGNQDWSVAASPLQGRVAGSSLENLVISVYSGLSLQPRQLFVLDPATGQLRFQTETSGNNLNFPIPMDIQGDGISEITGNSFAPWNYGGKTVDYPDSCAWLMCYDQQLELIHSPVSVCGNPAYVSVLPIRGEARPYLVTLFYSRTSSGTENVLTTWEWKGDSLHRVGRRVYDTGARFRLLLEAPDQPDQFYLTDSRQIMRMNRDLEAVEQVESNGIDYYSDVYPIDINRDGSEELVVLSNPGKLTVFDESFRHPVELETGLILKKPVYSTFRREGKNLLGIFSNQEWIEVVYSKNPFYPFRFLILLLLFSAYFLTFSLIARVQRKRIEFRQQSEKQLLRYQLTNVMQQLDPHFLFNALNNISSFYHKGAKWEAQAYVSRISGLIRTSIENSEKMTISLIEEMDFVRDYLTLERIRMGGGFDFSMEMDETGYPEVQVPKMLIQNFAENGVKHGIRHLKKRRGMIRITSRIEQGTLQLEVEDNGVGRRRAAEFRSPGAGRGIVMVREMLELYERLTRIRITFRMEDLCSEDGSAAGTRVVIRIPLRS